MTASGGDKASSPHFFSSSRVQPGGKPPGHFFCRRRRPTTGRDGPCFCPYLPPPVPPSRRAQGPPPRRPGSGLSPLRRCLPRWGKHKRYAAKSQRPGLVRPRPVGPRRRWCGLVAGGGAPGPWSACVRSRCWPPENRGATPPRRGRSAVGRWPGRWLRPPWRGVGGLACVRAPPAPDSTSPRRGPPVARPPGWGRPPVWGPPVVLFGLAPGGRKPRFSPSPGGRKGRRDYTRRPRKHLPRATKERCPPCGLRPAAPPMRGGWGKVHSARQRGGRVCAGNPGRVSCT